MAKTIVVLSDGTGNTAVKGRGTNVFKMFESVDLNGHRFDPNLRPQVAIYDDGVGTEDFKPLKLLAGATGYGLSSNVRQLYQELCRVYDPDDRIFLFGFSRGAFTVRTLAGLICTCGLINAGGQHTAAEFQKSVTQAYKAYRGKYRTELMKLFRGEPGPKAMERFRQAHPNYHYPKIAFMGVWDTVDAVGLPFHISDVINTTLYRFKFPDSELCDLVEHACHALAIDEERHSFFPLLWKSVKGDLDKHQVIEQVWFAGAHSNVGGGYPKQGMSLVALDWLMQKAADDGLRLVDSDRTFYREHANVDDKLYDPRAGLGIFYRWKPRDITAICKQNGVAPYVHLSALERIAHGTDDYAPGNLPPNARVVITPTGDLSKDRAAKERACAVENVLKSAHPGPRPLLAGMRTEVFVGDVSYYVYLLACIGVVLVAATPDKPILFMPGLLKYVAQFIANLARSPIETLLLIVPQLLANPVRLGALVGGFVGAYLMALYADRRMSAAFSSFWFEQQRGLRDALKRARIAAQAARTRMPSPAPGGSRSTDVVAAPSDAQHKAP